MSKMLKIIHCADLHMDSPFEAMGNKAAQRRREQRRLLERIGNLALEKAADLLLLPGDLLDTGRAYMETLGAICQVLGSLDIPVFIAPGNHDYYSAASPYAKAALPENVHIFTKSAMECVCLPELGAKIYGAAFTDRSAPAMLRGFTAENEDGVLNIGVLHGEVTESDSAYCPVSLSDISGSGLDYLALGHVHTQSGLLRSGDTFYAWPGCPEGRGFDECGEKGVYYVELEKGACHAEFIPTAARRYEIMSLPAEEELLSLLPEDTAEDIYRIILTGEAETPPDIKHLEEELAGRFFALQIKDKTTPKRDIWQFAEQDNLRGLFLRRMRDMLESAESPEEKEKINRALRWGIMALEGGEAVEEI